MSRRRLGGIASRCAAINSKSREPVIDSRLEALGRQSGHTPQADADKAVRLSETARVLSLSSLIDSPEPSNQPRAVVKIEHLLKPTEYDGEHWSLKPPVRVGLHFWAAFLGAEASLAATRQYSNKQNITPPLCRRCWYINPRCWAHRTTNSSYPGTKLASKLPMNTNPQPNRRIQRGPPNMVNLPDMFREIADSLRRSFCRARASLARRRQGTCSILPIPIHNTTPYWPTADGSCRQTIPPRPRASRARVALQRSVICRHRVSKIEIWPCDFWELMSPQAHFHSTSTVHVCACQTPRPPPYELLFPMASSSPY